MDDVILAAIGVALFDDDDEVGKFLAAEGWARDDISDKMRVGFVETVRFENVVEFSKILNEELVLMNSNFPWPDKQSEFLVFLIDNLKNKQFRFRFHKQKRSKTSYHSIYFIFKSSFRLQTIKNTSCSQFL